MEIYALLKLYRAFKVIINSFGTYRSQLFLGVLGGDCIKQRKANASRLFNLSARLELKGIVSINAIDYHRCKKSTDAASSQALVIKILKHKIVHRAGFEPAT